jgi:hypothetical protein
MPHERGPLPVPPSEFICVALADPKARFCRSLASHSPIVKGNPIYPFDPEALSYKANSAAQRPVSTLDNGRLHANPQISRRANQNSPIPLKKWNRQKIAHWL